MFVFQNKVNKQYVRRLARAEGTSSADTYSHEPELADATVFAGWWEIAHWFVRRIDAGFYAVPTEWQLVEVETVPQPKVRVVKVIG